MEAFATVKQPQFFVGDFLESSDASCIMCEKLRKSTADLSVTTVADAALDSDGYLGLS